MKITMTKTIVHNAIKATMPVKGVVQVWTKGFISANGTEGHEPMMPVKGEVHGDIHSYCFVPEKIVQVENE